MVMYHASDSTGNCSVCRKTFRDAQGFYEHFDNCVMLKVMQGDPSGAINHMRLAEGKDDEEVKMLRHHFLDAEDPTDQPDYKNSHGDVSVHNDELLPASGIKRYPSEDESIAQKGTKRQNILEPEPAKENNLPGQINLEVHEPAIGDNDTTPVTRYKCQECDKLDTHMRGTLLRHVNDMHFPRRMFFCPEKGCHDVLKPRQHQIRDHVRLAHKREPTQGELLRHKRDMPCPPQCPGCSLPIRTWDEFTKCYPEHCTYKVFYD
jgi:hypothetical protein